MISVKRNFKRKIKDGIIRGKIFRPKKMFTSQFNRRRKETKHSNEYRHLEQSRNATSKWIYSRFAIQGHRFLLLFHRIIRIFCSELGNLRLQYFHLRLRFKRTVRKRQDHNTN